MVYWLRCFVCFVCLVSSNVFACAAPWKVILANGAHIVTAVVDVELTQRCLHSKSCHEVNPLMPTNRAGAYAVQGATITLDFVVSRKMHAWWLPLIGAGVHGVGIVSGIKNQ